jgi:hypothetical protein
MLGYYYRDNPEVVRNELLRYYQTPVSCLPKAETPRLEKAVFELLFANLPLNIAAPVILTQCSETPDSFHDCCKKWLEEISDDESEHLPMSLAWTIGARINVSDQGLIDAYAQFVRNHNRSVARIVSHALMYIHDDRGLDEIVQAIVEKTKGGVDPLTAVMSSGDALRALKGRGCQEGVERERLKQSRCQLSVPASKGLLQFLHSTQDSDKRLVVSFLLTLGGHEEGVAGILADMLSDSSKHTDLLAIGRAYNWHIHAVATSYPESDNHLTTLAAFAENRIVRTVFNDFVKTCEPDDPRRKFAGWILGFGENARSVYDYFNWLMEYAGTETADDCVPILSSSDLSAKMNSLIYADAHRHNPSDSLYACLAHLYSTVDGGEVTFNKRDIGQFYLAITVRVVGLEEYGSYHCGRRVSPESIADETNIAAVRALCEDKRPPISFLLKYLAKLEDVTLTLSKGDDGRDRGLEKHNYSMDARRRMAVQELARRGNLNIDKRALVK